MPHPFHYNSTPKILSFFPNVRGVGYSLFTEDRQHQTSGMITTRSRYTNDKYIIRMKERIDIHQPKILVLEEYRKSKGSVKTKRIASLIKTIADYAKKQNIEVVLYKRSNIRDIFSFYNAMKKYDIAQLICLWIPSLEYYMYKPRSGQRMEPYSSAVFDAVSLCITWFYRES